MCGEAVFWGKVSSSQPYILVASKTELSTSTIIAAQWSEHHTVHWILFWTLHYILQNTLRRPLWRCEALHRSYESWVEYLSTIQKDIFHHPRGYLSTIQNGYFSTIQADICPQSKMESALMPSPPQTPAPLRAKAMQLSEMAILTQPVRQTCLWQGKLRG